MAALAAGDLSQRINRDYAGTFDQLKTDANATSEKLSGIIEDVGRVFSGLATGDLSQRITRNAEGTFNSRARPDRCCRAGERHGAVAVAGRQ